MNKIKTRIVQQSIHQRMFAPHVNLIPTHVRDFEMRVLRVKFKADGLRIKAASVPSYDPRVIS